MTGITFIGRQEELEILNELHQSPHSEFCVLYGRRRIGKSTLLEKFTEDKPRFFYLAGKEDKQQQLKRFVKELGETAGDPLTGRVRVSIWDEALELLDRTVGTLCQRRRCRKVIIVFDEFQWMCGGALELLTDLQRFWDKRWKNAGNVFLIVCGSAISFMVGEVLSQKSPLFGRRTKSFDLRPFPLHQAAEFLPGWPPWEVLESYMAVGGIPKYLELLSRGGSFRKAMAREAYHRAGFFFDEARFLLGEQLRETGNYFSILEQLAGGACSVTELSRRTGLASGQLMHYLERLQRLGFVARHLRWGAKSTSKTIRYHLDDAYLRFYFTFVHPNRERIISNPSGVRFGDIVQQRWDVCAGLAFEHFVRTYAATVVEVAWPGATIQRVGTYWQQPTKRKRGVQVDLIIECDDKTWLVCECKWSQTKTGVGAVRELREKLALIPNPLHRRLRPVLIAAGGVTEAVHQETDLSVVTVDDFFR